MQSMNYLFLNKTMLTVGELYVFVEEDVCMYVIIVHIDDSSRLINSCLGIFDLKNGILIFSNFIHLIEQ